MFTTQHCDEKHTFRHIIYFLMMSEGVGRGGGGGGSICALLSTSCFVNSTYRWIFIRGIICLPGKEARRRREGRCGGARPSVPCHMYEETRLLLPTKVGDIERANRLCV